MLKGWYHNCLGMGSLRWKQQRKLGSYDFSTKALRDSSAVVFGKKAAKLGQLFAEAARDYQTLEFQVSLKLEEMLWEKKMEHRDRTDKFSGCNIFLIILLFFYFILFIF